MSVIVDLQGTDPLDIATQDTGTACSSVPGAYDLFLRGIIEIEDVLVEGNA